jgi:hypothetical protein
LGISTEVIDSLRDFDIECGLVLLSGDTGFVENSLDFHLLDVVDGIVDEVLELALDGFLLFVEALDVVNSAFVETFVGCDL